MLPAMKAHRASKTAEQMALSRAIEARVAAGDRICDDAFAERFLPRGQQWLLRSRAVRRAMVSGIERLFAGHHHYVLARTRYLDEFLLQQLQQEVEQLVILGAGFDSRPYRFADRLRGISVFEVDHPATSALKRAKIQAILGAVPSEVRFVPIDFNRDELGPSLTNSGFRAGARSLFLWEGTVPYLAAEAVDETLRFVRSSSRAGSRIVFDYLLRSVLDGTCTFRGAATEYARMSQTPEPFVYGLPADRVADFLAERGFGDVRDAGGDELKTPGFPVSRQAVYVKPWWRIVCRPNSSRPC